jgi:uncharacterized protein (DUF4415 family)
MRKEYDFSEGTRGPVVPTVGKERITIRLDEDVVRWFKKQVEDAGGGNDHTLINQALRDYMAHRSGNRWRPHCAASFAKN